MRQTAAWSSLDDLIGAANDCSARPAERRIACASARAGRPRGAWQSAMLGVEQTVLVLGGPLFTDEVREQREVLEGLRDEDPKGLVERVALG